MAIEQGQKPFGLETLSFSAVETIRRYASGPLEELSVPDLIKLRDEVFGPNTSIAYCIPDHAEGIRSALSLRIFNIIEAARHAGTIMTKEDAEEERERIGQALGSFSNGYEEKESR